MKAKKREKSYFSVIVHVRTGRNITLKQQQEQEQQQIMRSLT